MHCLVTAGPTSEPLDRVRRLTNFSTGQLGSSLSAYLAGQGHKVTLLRGSGASAPAPEGISVLPFTTTDDLRTQMRAWAGREVHAIFHTAAVSDFRFGQVFHRSEGGALIPIQSGKFSTRTGPLLAELVPTPKILSELREWFPEAWIVGWKYEVEGTQADALAAGREQLRSCRTDACVVNGPAYGDGYGLLLANGNLHGAADAPALFAALLSHAPGASGG